MTNYDLKKIYSWPTGPRLFAVGLVSIMVLFFGYFFDISNLNVQCNVGRQKEITLLQEYQTVVNRQASVNATVKQLPILRNMFQQWKKIEIDPSRLTESLNEILKAGSNNYVQLGLFKTNPLGQENGYSKILVTMTIIGSYVQTADFISQIANMPMLIKIGDFTMISDTYKESNKMDFSKLLGSNNNLKTDLSLEVYEGKQGKHGN